ncbi:MAG TPA: Zn-ribbon domain-containing protein [Methanothrix sp.]|nr:Zn-ribbon domain-containing protein [Methanothrix sp.]
MPHICTRCNSVFDSGEDILKGCPKCGWKKFMFVKKAPAKGDDNQEQIITRAMGVRVPPRGARRASPPEPEGSLKPEVHKPARPKEEIHPQDHPPVIIPTPAKPEGKALESIKITAPGTYELNLPSLFERDELIMAVKEGTYFIDLSSAFKKGKKD